MASCRAWSPSPLPSSFVRCPFCRADDSKVVDSRTADDGAAIRRRRECLACASRFTTYERLDEVPLIVLKQDGRREPFDRGKVLAGVRAAAKNRPVDEPALDALVGRVEDQVRCLGSEVASEQIGHLVLAELRQIDEVAYVRFASVYKDFSAIDDFQRELSALAPDTPDDQRSDART
jgi:transcriptional repressor NrdR